MKINPTKLGWSAPKTNEDGTEITYSLEYEVGKLVAPDTIEPIMVVASQLQEGGRYEAPLSDVALGYGEHTLMLRTFAKDDPKRKSKWSVGVTFALSAEIPNAPLDLSAY
jgi:hypothetical protein